MLSTACSSPAGLPPAPARQRLGMALPDSCRTWVSNTSRLASAPATSPCSDAARVVVIGGGAAGTSALYHLASRGWTDCLLLEMAACVKRYHAPAGRFGFIGRLGVPREQERMKVPD